MTTDELYDFMKHSLDQIQKQLDEIKETLKGIDERLRNIEKDVAEVKGRRVAVKDWLVVTCAIGALVVSIIALMNK